MSREFKAPTGCLLVWFSNFLGWVEEEEAALGVCEVGCSSRTS